LGYWNIPGAAEADVAITGVARVAGDLESLRNEATAAGRKLAIAYLIDLALLEARQLAGKAS
jgi:hypothetical protein